MHCLRSTIHPHRLVTILFAWSLPNLSVRVRLDRLDHVRTPRRLFTKNLPTHRWHSADGPRGFDEQNQKEEKYCNKLSPVVQSAWWSTSRSPPVERILECSIDNQHHNEATRYQLKDKQGETNTCHAADEMIANTILDNPRALRQSSNIRANVYVKPDLTKGERLAAYELRVKRRKDNESGQTPVSSTPLIVPIPPISESSSIQPPIHEMTPLNVAPASAASANQLIPSTSGASSQSVNAWLGGQPSKSSIPVFLFNARSLRNKLPDLHLLIYSSEPGRLFTKKRTHDIHRSKFVTQKLVFTKKCKLAIS